MAGPVKHDHADDDRGGGTIRPGVLYLPAYDDVSNATGAEAGNLVYATGNGTTSQGVYKYDGSSYVQVGSNNVTDSGTDTDGGDNYQLPQAADNLDLQTDGAIQNADSIDTKDLLNATIGDGVDYSDPLWLAKTDALRFHSLIESLDGWGQTTSGSGSVSLSPYGPPLHTGTTNGSQAKITKGRINQADLIQLNWDKNSIFAAGVRIRDSSDDRTDYMTVGDVEAGEEGYGFKISSGALEGVVHNGTSETTTELIASTSLGTGGKKLRAILNAGTDVEFFVGGTSQGTVSSGLPSGVVSANPYEIATFSVTNTSAVQRRQQPGEVRVVQRP